MRTRYGEKYWDKLCGKPMPEESTPPIWKENYLLQKQYIEELEREIDRLNMRILSLEVAGQNVVYQAIEMWKRGAIKEWLDLVRKEEDKP